MLLLRLNSSSYNRNAISSPLLRLPPELRKIIYGYALGGHLIAVDTEGWWVHNLSTDVRTAAVRHKRRFPLRHWVCDCRDSPKACGRFLDDNSALRLRSLYDTDSACIQNKLSFGLLRTCWSIYEDARLIPFSSNCFSFFSGVVFTRCVLFELSASQQQALREVHLHSELGMPWPNVWDTTFSPKMLSQLSGLRKVYLAFVKTDVNPRPLNGLLRDSNRWQEDQWIQGFLNLQCLPLSDVTVTVWRFQPFSYISHIYTPARFEQLETEETRAYAERVKQRLLAQPDANTS